MPAQSFPTKRSISQVIRRHTPGSLMYIEEHGITARVQQVRGDRDVTVDLARLHAQVRRYLQRWEKEGGRLLNIDSEISMQDLAPVAPSHVLWEPYPHSYRCVKHDCQVFHESTDRDFSGRCRRCGSELRQLPYVFYHRCGLLQYLRIPPKVRCDKHGTSALFFHDTRRFTTSSWRCRECTYERAFFFPICNRQTCREQDPNHPRVQGSFWNDQWVHYGQTLDFINLDEQMAARFLGNPRGLGLLHAGVLGEIGAGRHRLLRALEDAGELCPNCQSEVQAGARFCSQCGYRIPGTLFERSSGTWGEELQTASDSGRCAWALLRDLDATRSLRDLVSELNVEEKSTGEPDWSLAKAESAGVSDILLVTSFPLTTAAVGFTRDRSGPPAWLRAFDKIDDRTPIYTQSVETEAWLVQLKASTLRAWLIANQVEPFASVLRALPDDETSLARWFIERLSVPLEDMPPDDTRLRSIVTSLLHSLSHVTLLSLGMHAGLEATSLGEMLLPDALGFAIYAGDSDLGALTAAFDQLIGVVFAGAKQHYEACKFDPGCSHDDGGACVGCIQLYRGCQLFNEDLSRAYLWGGRTGSEIMGSVSWGYFAVGEGLC